MVRAVLTEKPKVFSLKTNDDCYIQLGDFIFPSALDLHVFNWVFLNVRRVLNSDIHNFHGATYYFGQTAKYF